MNFSAAPAALPARVTTLTPAERARVAYCAELITLRLYDPAGEHVQTLDSGLKQMGDATAEIARAELHKLGRIAVVESGLLLDPTYHAALKASLFPTALGTEVRASRLALLDGGGRAPTDPSSGFTAAALELLAEGRLQLQVSGKGVAPGISYTLAGPSNRPAVAPPPSTALLAPSDNLGKSARTPPLDDGVPRPWVRADGSTDTKLLFTFGRRALSHVLLAPGVPHPELLRRLGMTDAAAAGAIIGALVDAGALEARLVAPLATGPPRALLGSSSPPTPPTPPVPHYFAPARLRAAADDTTHP